jgi:putative ABC transport system substrate-binding protein
MADVGRRAFVTLIALMGGGTAAAAALAWPLPALAQQPGPPVVGYLYPGGSQGSGADQVAAFRKGLGEAGYIEGQNVAIEYRWAEGHYDRLASLATELAQRNVAVIAVGGGAPSIRAAKAATARIPIAFITGTDPVADGVVKSFNQPGGNLTGIYVLFNVLVAKQLEVLHELVPAAATIAMLDNASGPSAEIRAQTIREAALALGVKLLAVSASTEREVDGALASLAEQRVDALLIAADPFLTGRRDQILALAARHALPTIASFRDYPIAGGLMSYGPNLTDAYRQLGVHAGRILKGARPAELPVEQSTKVEFVVNLKTARTLGLTFPLPLIGRADEVIE